VDEKGNEFHIEVIKGNAGGKTGEVKEESPSSNITVYVHLDRMGQGDDDLGRILIKGFIKTIKDVDPKPRRMIFVNSGIFLTTEGSEVINALRELEETGIEILSCGTCLDFFNRKDKLEVGLASNMFDITSALMQSDKVVIP